MRPCEHLGPPSGQRQRWREWHLVLLGSPSGEDGEDIVSACRYGTSDPWNTTRKSVDQYAKAVEDSSGCLELEPRAQCVSIGRQALAEHQASRSELVGLLWIGPSDFVLRLRKRKRGLI